MGAFLDWFFAFLTTMIDGIWKIISGIFGGIIQIFNIVDYVKQFNTYNRIDVPETELYKSLEELTDVFNNVIGYAILFEID